MKQSSHGGVLLGERKCKGREGEGRGWPLGAEVTEEKRRETEGEGERRTEGGGRRVLLEGNVMNVRRRYS